MKVANHIEAHTAAQANVPASNKASQAAESSGSSFLDSLDSMMAAANTASQKAASSADKAASDASSSADADFASNVHRELAGPLTADLSPSNPLPSTNAPATTPLASSDSLKWTSKLSADPIVSTGSGSNLVKGKFNGDDDDKSNAHKNAPISDPSAPSAPILFVSAPVTQPVQWSLDPQSLNSGTHTAPIAVNEQAGSSTGTQTAPVSNQPIAAGHAGQPALPAGVDTTGPQNGPQNNAFDPTSQQAEVAPKPAPASADATPAAATHQAQEAAAASTAAAASILDANALSAQSAVTDPGVAALASQALAASMSKNFNPAQNAAGAVAAAAAARTSGLSANYAATKTPSKNPIKDITDSKSDSSLTVQADSQAGSNVKTSTSDHAQHDGSMQQQQAPIVPVVAIPHTADPTLHQQAPALANTLQTSSSANRPTQDAASAAHDQAAEAAAASNNSEAPVAQPSSINTARLIQSVGQSEMRVGMRSAEFGDISIRTSATHNSLSAQISLDHADLAKALTAHLPDMQARLGGNGNVDVRVNNAQSGMSQNGSQSGSQNHNPAGSSNGSDGSGNRGQQSSSNSYSQSRSYNLDQQFAGVPAALAATGVSTGRLSIQA